MRLFQVSLTKTDWRLFPINYLTDWSCFDNCRHQMETIHSSFLYLQIILTLVQYYSSIVKIRHSHNHGVVDRQDTCYIISLFQLPYKFNWKPSMTKIILEGSLKCVWDAKYAFYFSLHLACFGIIFTITYKAMMATHIIHFHTEAKTMLSTLLLLL